MICARVVGSGSYLPPEICSNNALRHRGVDTTDEWIVQRTGIRQRHFAQDGVLTVDLAEQAAQAALQAAQVPASQVDLIILSTSTPDSVGYPSVACTLQGRLGNAGAAFDVQAACSGFIYALVLAEKLVISGAHRCALVIGAEINSRILDWRDRSTCVLFGDGAGAVVLRADSRPGILASALRADGSRARHLKVPGHPAQGQLVGDPYVRMDGSVVFKTAVHVLSDVSRQVVSEANMSVADIDWVIPHQANIRIIHAVASQLALPEEKFIRTVDVHANTSSASIPLALDTAVRDGRIRSGHHLLLHAIGGGFTWGAALLTW